MASQTIMASATGIRLSSKPSLATRTAAFAPVVRSSVKSRQSLRVRASDGEKAQVVQPINGDPFIGMLETPVTSAPIVANFLSSLPAYRTGVSPLLRGVEVGLVHGLILTGPFIKLGPLRNVPGYAEVAGCLSAGALVAILTAALTLYGAVSFQQDTPQLGVKTLSGREINRDRLQSGEGWSNFTAGFFVGAESGVAWGYILSQILPYYQ
ncbi:hypothetical protein WJX79_003725 [Trebouxia sp. C0005]|nr:MAG: photosystem I reaction center subunit XI [Trebouxia sp. A1-2]